MSPSVDDVAQAVLQAVHGFYPEADDIASAELSPETLPSILDLLERTFEQTKQDIKQLNDTHKDDISVWTKDAQVLNDSLSSTKDAAHEIERLEKEVKDIQDRSRDLTLKHDLLTSELRFNEELVNILSSLQYIQSLYDDAEEYAIRGELLPASEQIEQADHALTGYEELNQVLAVELLKERSKSLKEALTETVEEYWSSLVQMQAEDQSITIYSHINVATTQVAGEVIVETLKNMKLLKDKVNKIYHHLDSVFLAPRITEKSKTGDVIAYAFDTNAATMRVRGKSHDLSADSLYSDLKVFLEFLANRLDSRILTLLARTMMPSIISRLTSVFLPSSIPDNLQDLPLFQDVLQATYIFETYLEEKSWITSSERDLRDWVERAPKLWLGRRRERCLERLKNIFDKGLGPSREVERIETMTEVDGNIEENGFKQEDTPSDNWDSKWESDGEDRPVHTAGTNTNSKLLQPRKAAKDTIPETAPVDDEDVSGWGLDDINFEDEEAKSSDPSEPLDLGTESIGDDKAVEMDWEWGEEDQVSKEQPARPREHSRKASIAGITGEKRGANVILREMYKITSVPQGVMDIITQTLREADELHTEAYSTSTVAPSSSGLVQIPSLVLAGYRALSSLFYQGELNSTMCLYNDCVWLEEQISKIQHDHQNQGYDLNLSADKIAISTYGKRVYSKEIESQKLIIHDLLDGAQGFVSCTEYPLSNECETAIAGVVGQIKQNHQSWKDTLSQSNLYQATGALLHTSITKLINDIEDLSDISADESHKLAILCGEISKLETLFIPANSDENAVPVTAIYCDQWLKFQYLIQILECTMVELMSWWREGTLVDFDNEELIDLVKALFADGEKRSKVIEELRRGH